VDAVTLSCSNFEISVIKIAHVTVLN